MKTVELPVAPNTASTSSVTRIFMSFPEGRVRLKVKEVEGVLSYADQVHPKRKHLWREMLDERRRYARFVECRCGAIGVPYRGGRSR